MSLAEILDKTLETTVGSKRVRELLAADRPTVFVSYPRDFTKTCTQQLCHYRDDWGELSKLRCQWWGINKEPVEKHERFKKEKLLPFELISDPRGELLSVLGLDGLLWVKRGFAVVSPDGEILGTSSINAFTYQQPDEVKKILEPLIAS